MFCSNHNSHMDVAILMASWRQSFRHYGMLAAKDYWFDNKIKKFLTGIILTLIPIDRGSEGEKTLSIDETIELCKTFTLKGKRNLIFFPEGTRSLTGQISPLKKGAAFFAIRLALPIVPVHIKGTYTAWPKGSIFMKPRKISVIIGEPLYQDRVLDANEPNPADPEEMEYRAVQRMTEDLESAIRKLEEINRA